MLTLTVSAFALAQKSPSEGQNMLADRHVAEHGTSCADCHGEENPSKNPATEKCLDCHGTYEDLGKLTANPDEEMNPHANHYGPVPCQDCHKSHAKPVLFCDDCHSFGTKVP